MVQWQRSAHCQTMTAQSYQGWDGEPSLGVQEGFLKALAISETFILFLLISFSLLVAAVLTL